MSIKYFFSEFQPFYFKLNKCTWSMLSTDPIYSFCYRKWYRCNRPYWADDIIPISYEQLIIELI